MLPVAAALDYEKIQRDEVEVLKSIFMDDYEHMETAGAWNVSQIFVLKRERENNNGQRRVLMRESVSDRNPILHSSST